MFDGVVKDSTGAAVVGLEGSGGLRVTKFGECCLEAAGVLGVVEKCCNFCFCGTGKDIFHDDTGNVYGAIKGRGFGGSCVGSGEEENTACTRACFGLGEIGSIGVDMEDHGATGVPDDGIGVGGGIIEQLVGGA